MTLNPLPPPKMPQPVQIATSEPADEREPDAPDLTDEGILTLARQRWTRANDARSGWAAKSLEDGVFAAGEQWDIQDEAARDAAGRPSLVVDRILSMVVQVTNDIRQNRPALLVSPLGGGASKETAEVLQGLLRHIEYDSDADAAYDMAVWNAATGGLGWLALSAEYESPDSFDQVLKIGRVRNALAVVVDPGALSPVAADAEFGFILTDYSVEGFKAAFPDAVRAQAPTWTTLGVSLPDWVSTDGCRVADYYCKEWTTATVYRVQPPAPLDPQTGMPGPLPAPETYTGTEAPPEGTEILAQRPTRTCVVKHYKITADEILQRTVWPGHYLPLVRVPGMEIETRGSVDYIGLVRQAKGPQRAYNYAISAALENVALSPKAPFIGYAGQFSDPKWETANTDTFAYLEVDPVMAGGAPAPLPQRNYSEPPIAACMQLVQQAGQDLQAVTNVYDAALGNRSNETSGLAIQRRTAQSATGTLHFADNLKRSIRHVGRIALGVIPTLYDTARTLRIIGEDDTAQQVDVNQPTQKAGQPAVFDLTAGQYDCTVDSGPSYQTKRQEGSESLFQLMKTLPPQQSAVIGDLAVRASDIPYAAEAAERIKKTLPPGIVPPEHDAQGAPDPHLQQMQQQVQHLQQQVQEAQSGMAVEQAKIASAEKIARWRIEADLQKAEMDVSTKATLATLQHEMDVAHALIAEIQGGPPAGPTGPDGMPPMPQGAGPMMPGAGGPPQ